MKAYKLLRSLLGIITVAVPGMHLEAAGTTPRLVVGINIDQLNTDYLEWFMDGFSEDGFKKIIQNGLVYRNMVYDYPRPDAASASASISCGNIPNIHGIISRNWFDRSKLKVVSSVSDPEYLGNYTSSTVSPKNLLCSTIGDELKNCTNGEAKVFSIGISAEDAILSAGHVANGVFWIDDETGKWCTSTYYNYMPWWLQNVNDSRDISQIIDQTKWEPLYPLSFYQYMPYQVSPTLFQYWLNKFGKDKFRMYKETPVVNTEVCNIGLQTIEKEKLGTDEIPDYIVFNLTASGNLDNSRVMSAVEIQDIYFRLDQEIQKIVELVERQAGLENALIYLTGTGEPRNPAVENPKSIYGNFYPERCTSLLNLYLMAIYGNEKWVSAYQDQQIYLNKNLIEKKGINFDEISLKAAEFLGEFSGVQRVIRNKQLISGDYDILFNKYRNGQSFNRSGDIFLEIQPGWNIRNNNGEKDYQVRYEAYNTTLVFFGSKIKAQTVFRPISSSDIASTLSKVFRIRPPNASCGTVLQELHKQYQL
jgi:hypothetical protein